MDHFDMNFLNAVSIAKVRHANFDIRAARHFAAIFAGQGDNFHPFLTRCGNRFNHVTGITRSRDA